MTNTNTTPRMPNVKTARARLAERGIDAEALQGKALKQAWIDAHAEPAPAPVEEPAAPAAPAAPGNFPLCGCGCGSPTVTAKAKFLSGHDARFAGMVGRGEVTPTPAQEALITDALQAKIDGIAATARKRAAAKAAKAAAKVAAAKAYAEAMASA
jgi:hypothetical protein